MRRTTLLVGLFALTGQVPLGAQSGPATTSAEPFKVGTFDIGGVPQVGLVLRDRLVVDIETANTALEVDPAYPKLAMPADMLELIGQYEYGLRHRLYEIVNHLVASGQLEGGNAPPYVHEVSELRIRPPIMYPGKILNAAVNFFSHVSEGAAAAEREEAMRERRENRGVPYLFLKPSRGVVIGASDTIVLPYGRDRMDWEVELGAVIGRAGKYISANDAQDHVFGYLVSVDVSDRGGRPPGGYSSGSDWFVSKGHDTAAPQGPWIVPKEFYGDPMTMLRQRLTVDGRVVQDAEASDMIHTLWELIEYGSSIVTLYPGDVINNGTSGGTAAGTTTRGEDPYLKPGEVIEVSIDGIGTMTLHVRGEEEPTGLTGAQLPPIRTYRPPPF